MSERPPYAHLSHRLTPYSRPSFAASLTLFRQRLDGLNLFIRVHGIPPDVAQRLRRYMHQQKGECSDIPHMVLYAHFPVIALIMRPSPLSLLLLIATLPP